MAKLVTLIKDASELAESPEGKEFIYTQLMVKAALELLLAAEAYQAGMSQKVSKARVRNAFAFLAKFPVYEFPFPRLPACSETDPQALKQAQKVMLAQAEQELAHAIQAFSKKKA